MDDVKDIQKTDQVNKFLDTSVRTKPFGANISGERAYRRAERLVAALHLLTNHIAHEEPVRREVRAMAIRLLSDILKLRDGLRIPASSDFKDVLGSIRELITLIRVLAVSGYISVQNAEVVSEALDELGNFLGSTQRSALSETITMTRDELVSLGQEYVKDIKDKYEVKGKRTKSDSRGRSSVTEARSERIINVLKNKGESGIKDISSNLPEYSEKMVQRELSTLVSMGRVKKTGFKRWSKYLLAQ